MLISQCKCDSNYSCGMRRMPNEEAPQPLLWIGRLAVREMHKYIAWLCIAITRSHTPIQLHTTARWTQTIVKSFTLTKHGSFQNSKQKRGPLTYSLKKKQTWGIHSATTALFIFEQYIFTLYECFAYCSSSIETVAFKCYHDRTDYVSCRRVSRPFPQNII